MSQKTTTPKEKPKPKTQEQLFTEAVKRMCKINYGEIYEQLLIAKKARDALNPKIRTLNENIDICEQALKIRRMEDHLE